MRYADRNILIAGLQDLHILVGQVLEVTEICRFTWMLQTKYLNPKFLNLYIIKKQAEWIRIHK